MTGTLTPLTSAELADLKVKAKIIPVIKSATVLRLIDMIERLQSGDMKREIENAAFERVRREALNRVALRSDSDYGQGAQDMANEIYEAARAISALIQPPAQQKENGE